MPVAEALIKAGASVEAAGLSLTAAGVCLLADDIARLAKEVGAEEKQKALAAAAYNGRLDAIDTAIALGADPNVPNAGLNPTATALHNAVCSGSLAAVQQLVEAGASVGTKEGTYNATPLVWADYFVRASGAGKVGPSSARAPGPSSTAEIAAYFATQTGRVVERHTWGSDVRRPRHPEPRDGPPRIFTRPLPREDPTLILRADNRAAVFQDEDVCARGTPQVHEVAREG